MKNWNALRASVAVSFRDVIFRRCLDEKKLQSL